MSAHSALLWDRGLNVSRTACLNDVGKLCRVDIELAIVIIEDEADRREQVQCHFLTFHSLHQSFKAARGLHFTIRQLERTDVLGPPLLLQPRENVALVPLQDALGLPDLRRERGVP
jgi:hypothetical protein